MKIIIKENCDLIIERYPHFKSLNKSLKEDYLKSDFSESFKRSVQGKHSSYQTSSPHIDKVSEWVIRILRETYPHLMSPHLKLVRHSSWFSGYDIGEYATLHAHLPRSYSYVYYVQCPRGSSPLVFPTSGKKIKAEEGRVVIFPGHVHHCVPKNKCVGRIALAGNLTTVDSVDIKNIVKYT